MLRSEKLFTISIFLASNVSTKCIGENVMSAKKYRCMIPNYGYLFVFRKVYDFVDVFISKNDT